MMRYHVTLSSHEQLLIVVIVPLNSRVEPLHIYAARSHTNTYSHNNDYKLVRLMDTYRLESKGLVFNNERTYFSLLEEITFSKCQLHGFPFCRIPSPFYSAGLSHTLTCLPRRTVPVMYCINIHRKY